MNDFKIEVLSPAGSPESLEAAVRSGADAVYLGAKQFSARRNAENFSDTELAAAAKYCRIRGVKTYLTLNIMLKGSEMDDAINIVDTAYNCGINGIIVQDLGLARLIHNIYPDLELHASTQMSLHSPAALKSLKDMGFSRVVAAREMSKEQLKAFCNSAKELGLEVEVFVHGALCMSVSGQCLLSAVIGGRSGNRGLCAGPCRLPFKVSGGTGYDLSLKDLSLYSYITELKSMGVASLKIEGRMKRPEYIAAATCACRAAVDNGEVPDELYNVLERVFSRSGFTDGYYTSKLGLDMFGVRTEDDAAASKETYSYIHGLYRTERQSVGITLSALFSLDKNIALTLSDGDNTVTVSGDVPQSARLKSTEKQDIIQSLSKLGGTPYFAKQVDVKLDNGLYVPASSINALRRQGIEALNDARSKITAPKAKCYDIKKVTDAHIGQQLYARFSDYKNLPDDLSGISTLIMPAYLDLPDALPQGIRLAVELPRYVDDEQLLLNRLNELKSAGFTAAYCNNLSAVELAKSAGLEVIGGMFLNVCNKHSAAALSDMGVDEVTLSAEIDMRDAAALETDSKKGIFAYGYMPLMLLKNCPLKNGRGCAACDRKGYITDRMGKNFPLRCTKGYSELLNCTPLYIADKLSDTKKIDFLLLYFTDEGPQYATQIIEAYKQGKPPVGEYTRGLYYRTIL